VAASERISRTETAPLRHNDEHTTFLYDETGSGVRAEDRLARLREYADDDLWLVPAIALQQSGTEISSEYSQHERPNRTHLEYQECGQETEHQFREFEAVSNDDWTGQPIWGRQRCGTPHYSSP